MIFHHALIAKVLAGEITQTREKVRSGEDACRYQLDRDYAVQAGVGRPGVARVVVLRASRVRLGALSADDAVALGFETPADYLAHCAAIDPEGAVDVDAAVWAITFELLPFDRPTYLTRGRGDGRGYTTDHRRAIDVDPVMGPLEVVPDEYANAQSSWTPPKLKPRQMRPTIVEEAEEALRNLLLRHEGVDPDDLYALTQGRLGTPGEIRKRRRAMGLRGVDGLKPLPPERLEALVARMLAEGCSVRDLALVLDCSHGKAHNLIVQHNSDRQAA